MTRRKNHEISHLLEELGGTCQAGGGEPDRG